MLVLALLLLRGSLDADVRRMGGSRSDGAGWVQLHLSGTPREIGYQYGSLAAAEIDDAHRALRSDLSAPYDWGWYRETAKRLFWNKVDNEYREEMMGQAEGLRAKGYTYDVWDVLAYNANIELGGYYAPWMESQRTGIIRSRAKESCSAFVCTGSYTKDGRPVMGHNLWWDYKMGERANILLDIRPDKGHRFIMDAFAGMIHSGTDFAVNSAGITLCETTISGFAGFDPNGTPEFVRMRKVIQYSDSLDDVVRIFKTGNNGGYANTWLIADTRANRIGRLELGLKNVTLDTSNDGYFVGSNFPENPKLIREEVPGGWDANPKTNTCETRRARWKILMAEARGQIDAERGRKFLSDTFDERTGRTSANDAVLCGKGPYGGACNTKVVSAAMAANMEIWARMGFTDGSEKRFNAPAGSLLHDIKAQPWVRLGAN